MKEIVDNLISIVLHPFIVISTVNLIRTAIILSLAGLCFSGSFSIMQYIPTVQAQTQVATSQPSLEDLNIKMAQLSASNTPDGIALVDTFQ